jgi:gamma-glutamyltranspeptidase
MLANRGHHLVDFQRGGSAIQAISRLPDGRLHGISDNRKGGAPFGF